MSKVPIVLRNKTRFPLVFRYKSPHHLAFHKLTDGSGNPQTLEAGDVILVDTMPGASWEASIPSSDYVYGSQWVQPYKFMAVDIPQTVQQGQIFDLSESGFVNRDPAPGGMTGPMTGANPVQTLNTGAQTSAPGPDDENFLQAHMTAVLFAGGAVAVLLVLLALYWMYGRGDLAGLIPAA